MPRAKRNAEKGEFTRSAILKAAVELFGENGFRATTMNQIASRAGVVQSALHHHFGGKDQLLDAALKLHYPPAASRPDIEAVAKGKSNFVDEVLRAANRNAQDRDLVRFFSVMTGESLTGDHPAHEFFVARYDLVRQGFADAIAKAKGVESEESRRLYCCSFQYCLLLRMGCKCNGSAILPSTSQALWSLLPPSHASGSTP